MPVVSIVLPVKNAARFLEKTVRSIQSQTFNDWELIAVDDHSNDSTAEVLNRFSESDKRITFFQNSGAGIIPALQQGLSAASGAYITRMDGDDLMPPTRLKLMKDVLDQSANKVIVTGQVRYFSEGAISTGYKRYEAWLNAINQREQQWQNIYRECVVASPNWMMRTAELRRIGGFDNLCYPEDYHLVLRWYQHKFKIQCLPEITLHWREHPERTSRTSENYNQRAFFSLKIREFIQQDLKSADLVLWGTNEKGRLAADILTREHVHFHWMDLKARKTTIQGIPVRSYTDISELSAPQLLVAVYPEAELRKQIMHYLEEINLQEGKDWWWL